MDGLRFPLSARKAMGAAALLLLGLFAPGLGADAPPVPRGVPAPQDNASHVSDADPAVTKAFAEAEAALEARRYEVVVERLQEVIERRFEDAAAGRLVPDVVAVGGRAVYEGAWRVAQHRLLQGGPELRRAYAALHGPRARTLFEQAARHADEAQLAEIVRRFAALEEGRAAALLLSDLAAERGDDDAALGWLERLEDLEEVGDEPEEERAPWRAQRVRREARLLAARPESRGAIEAALLAAAQAGPAAAAAQEAIPWADRRGRPAPSTWTTTGGAPDRAALPAPLGLRLKPFALAAYDPKDPLEISEPQPPDERGSTSPWLPPRAVVGRQAVFVCDGATLHVLERSTLKRLDRIVVRRGSEGRVFDVQDAQDNLPLAEGDALTLEELPGGLTRIVVSSLRRLNADQDGEGEGRRPDVALACFLWDGQRLMRTWRVGGIGERGALPAGLSLHGAPCLYRGLLWTGGTRPTAATADHVECWLVGLDPATGRVRRQVLLASGSPVRAGRPDEAVPSSPAAARGRVVLATALGLVAAVDAEDGRIAWIYRHDRGLERGRARGRKAQPDDAKPRTTGFSNEPPVIAFGLVVVAPTDSDRVYGLLTRPRGRARDLERWDPLDRASYGLAVEYVAGAVGGDGVVPPAIVLVGQGTGLEGEAPGNVVLGLEPRLGDRIWSVAPATGHAPIPYGRAALTAREVFVPLAQGVLAVDLTRPAAQALLEPDLPQGAEEIPALAWLGNLVPVPGEGLLAVNLTHVALWRRR